MSNNTDYHQFIDNKEGWVDRRIFWEEEIYERELKQIFAKSWQFIAHDSMIPNANDFYTTYMGEDGVIGARQKDGSVKVFLNSCPHRGNKFCFADEGNTRSFICNYHGWSFGIDGKLGALANEHVYDEGDIDKDKWSPKQARVETYKGLIFATFDEQAPSLEEWLGDFTWYLDMMFDNDGETEFINGGIKSYVNANWKFGVENFIGDAYHALWNHDSGLKAMNNGEGFGPAVTENSFHASVNGHGWEFGTDGYADVVINGSEKWLNYVRDIIKPKIKDKYGELRSNIFGSLASVSIFPNISFLPGIQTFRVWLPRGPKKLELRIFTIVNKNMPEDIKQEINNGCMMTFNPAGVLEMDDGENWEGNTAVNKGYITRQEKLHYGCGITRQIDHEELPGIIYKGQFNDANQRHFYTRWADLMNAESWSDVPTRYTPRHTKTTK
ncbi:MAG: aromatic ring-hydroxylating dioxygenase subunit alpha [Cycloclasticus sp.]|nr:aromatic ring-hydroxylating dioxygenase subunit alpha [Cycloclasticus sp.]MBG97173.1 aromatic ring-hydroxylating dioxygenase subunit alpha [Cycloclasticus sp.]MCP4058224.1 aromatic ring-hydroxylating dioxygenase subunit alpha [Pseudoalteromonas sp.]HAI96766.1 aromatic ring-hydroxylating dioxygenase subunit alpha [Methylococcaceae bacterium]